MSCLDDVQATLSGLVLAHERLRLAQEFGYLYLGKPCLNAQFAQQSAEPVILRRGDAPVHTARSPSLLSISQNRILWWRVVWRVPIKIVKGVDMRIAMSGGGGDTGGK